MSMSQIDFHFIYSTALYCFIAKTTQRQDSILDSTLILETYKLLCLKLLLFRKFDIGLYVTMTSINPLRLYIYDSDALLRFCAKPYHPFNATDLHTYVVGDDYTPTWEVLNQLLNICIELRRI
jgi:hypothetical protein